MVVLAVLTLPGQRTGHSALLAGAQAIVLSGVTPTTGRVTVAVGAGVVTHTEVGQAGVGLS